MPTWSDPTYNSGDFKIQHPYSLELNASYFLFAALSSMIALCCVGSTFVFVTEGKRQYWLYFITSVLSFFSSATLLIIVPHFLLLFQDIFEKNVSTNDISRIILLNALMYGYWCCQLLKLFVSSNFMQLYGLDTWKDLWYPIRPIPRTSSKTQVPPLVPKSAAQAFEEPIRRLPLYLKRLPHAVSSLPNSSLPTYNPLFDSLEGPKTRRKSFHN
ncbi:hypothetical protein HMI54_010446 [Coelomomyces lativittatus]|nr:hypothetical protein HMI55_000118 [Coelomomyces lativittatus]KAJ1512584.1 hypothetical protein HMI56_003853 [Coelomomyces lativittatus]KAJ1516197.1 hypothetical protein HMI54_010446 [Coelomomyces lativittatus]